MKKTFYLISKSKAPARQVEWTKHEIKKYMDREKRKELPDGFDYWDFDCRIGLNEQELKEVYPNEIRKKIDEFALNKAESFFLEVLVKPLKFSKNSNK